MKVLTLYYITITEWVPFPPLGVAFKEKNLNMTTIGTRNKMEQEYNITLTVFFIDVLTHKTAGKFLQV